jgi:hypothetical protein
MEHLQTFFFTYPNPLHHNRVPVVGLGGLSFVLNGPNVLLLRFAHDHYLNINYMALKMILLIASL